MAIADDFSITVAGNITHVANTNTYTVLELHRWLQNLADDESPAVADDVVDITSLTPSERSTDNIITLLNGFNIDDTAAEFLYGGSITQDGGNIVYSGLKVLGAVNDTTNSQLEVIQDHDYYDTASPFWGTQSGGGLNGDAAGGVLMRILVKSRDGGADIDGKRVRVQCRQWGDSYDFFNVTLGQGEAVAAIGTTPDAQNTTAIGTVQGWTGGDIPTNTEGWQEIDILNGNGDKEYYSKWTYNTNSLLMRAIYEWIKEITGNDSPEAADPYDMIGELFLGITHWIEYTGTGGFTQNEKVYWGTGVSYDGLTGGTFSAGDYVVIKRATVIINGGKVLYDNGTTAMVLALEDITVSLQEDDVIEEAISGTVYADSTDTWVNDDKGGGEGIMLAENTTTDDLYIQLISGVVPSAPLVITGFTSSNTATFTTVAPETIPKTFLGSYTGSLIGAFGIGIDPDDLLSTDSVQPLVGAAQDPPNNVTFTLSGLISGDRILIGKKDTGNVFDWEEMLIVTDALDGVGETQVNVGAAGVPADAPASGVLRITLDDGRIRRQAYNSHDTQYFYITSADYSGGNSAAVGKGVMLAFIDLETVLTEEEFTLQFDAQRSLWIRVREGTSATPMKTYESVGTLFSTGGSAAVGRIDDY